MKHQIIKFFILFLLISTKIILKAQPSEPGYPLGLKNNLGYIDIPLLNIISVNNYQKLRQIDTCKTCPELYGFDVNIELNFWNMAKLDVVQFGNQAFEVYRYRVHSDSAEGLHVKFSDFSPGEDCKIYFYSPLDSERILGRQLHRSL